MVRIYKGGNKQRRTGAIFDGCGGPQPPLKGVHVRIHEPDAGYRRPHRRRTARGPACSTALLPSPACRGTSTHPGTSSTGQTDRIRSFRSRLVSPKALCYTDGVLKRGVDAERNRGGETLKEIF